MSVWLELIKLLLKNKLFLILWNAKLERFIAKTELSFYLKVKYTIFNF